MLFQYDPDSDMLYLQLGDRTSIESAEVAPGIVLDYDEDGQVVGIEIEDASKWVDLSRLELRALPVADLIVRERTPVTT